MINYYKCKYCGGSSIKELDVHEESCYKRPENPNLAPILPLRRETTKLDIKNFIKR